MTVRPTTGEPPLDQPYRGATLRAAFVRFWKKGFTFSGRASLSEYWKAYLANTVIGAVPYLLAILFGSIGGLVDGLRFLLWLAPVLLIFSLLYGVAALVPAIAAAVRRLHDADQPGTMYLLSLIPFVGGIIVIVLLCQAEKPGGARYDVAGRAHPAPATNPAALPPFGYASPAGAAPGVLTPPAAGAAPGYPAPPAFGAPVDDIDDRTYVPATAAPESAALPAYPPAPPAPASAPIAAVPGVSHAAEAPDLDATLLSAAAAVASAWALSLPDGRSIPVSGDVYLGRDPIARPEHPHALLVPIDDPAKSMSKTHARLSVRGGGAEIADLHSTNGTRISGAPTLAPGVAHPVSAGASIELGDYVVQLRRTTP